MKLTYRYILTPSNHAVVDPDDFDYLQQFRWIAHNHGYHYAFTSGWKGPRILMHVLILGKRAGFELDHINGQKYDNRRANLRFVTRQQNYMNTGLKKNNRSGFKGVCWYARLKKWRAYVVKDNKQYHIGVFETAEAAARAYDRKTKELHGEYAKLNYP